jgi:hypothetical protein
MNCRVFVRTGSESRLIFKTRTGIGICNFFEEEEEEENPQPNSQFDLCVELKPEYFFFEK